MEELAGSQSTRPGALTYLYADEMAALLGGALHPPARALGPTHGDVDEAEAMRPEARLHKALVALAADFRE
eukprot:5953707-Alexandrium_andersonii.AAC.1